MHEEIKKTLEVLTEGGIILYPTDTVWGIGCDATNEEAVQKIYTLKKRADSKSMLVLIDTQARILQYVQEVPEIAWQLLEVAVKPLTIIYPGAKNLAANLIAEDGSVGIRIPNDAFCQSLISRFRKPLVSTSANISGNVAPSTFAEVPDMILRSVDHVVRWRQDDRQAAAPSSIIKLGPGGLIEIIRE